LSSFRVDSGEEYVTTIYYLTPKGIGTPQEVRTYLEALAETNGWHPIATGSLSTTYAREDDKRQLEIFVHGWENERTKEEVLYEVTIYEPKS